MAVTLLRRIRQTAQIAPTRKTVLAVLAEFAAEDGTRVFPSIALLAIHTGLAERTVQGALRWLEAEGWIVRERAGGGRGKTNRWFVRGAQGPVQLSLFSIPKKGAAGARKGAGAAPDLSEKDHQDQNLPPLAAADPAPQEVRRHAEPAAGPADPGHVAAALCRDEEPVAPVVGGGDRPGREHQAGDCAAGLPVADGGAGGACSGGGRANDAESPPAPAARAFLAAYRDLVTAPRAVPRPARRHGGLRAAGGAHDAPSPAWRARLALMRAAGDRSPPPLVVRGMSAGDDEPAGRCA